MPGNTLLVIGSVVITLWGISHIAPTKGVVAGFGAISDTNRQIITMEWVAEGLTLCFIGLLVLVTVLMGGASGSASLIVYRASALMLIVMAAWTGVTGARTPIVPIKICPIVKSLVAILFFVGSAI